jgi:hypothetical protein
VRATCCLIALNASHDEHIVCAGKGIIIDIVNTGTPHLASHFILQYAVLHPVPHSLGSLCVQGSALSLASLTQAHRTLHHMLLCSVPCWTPMPHSLSPIVCTGEGGIIIGILDTGYLLDTQPPHTQHLYITATCQP